MRIALVLTLATVVKAANDALNFLVMGDWGGSPKSPYTTNDELITASAMNTAAHNLGAKFSLALGDNFYTTGVSKSTASVRFAETFESCFKGDALSSDADFEFNVIAGNHDHFGDVQLEIDYTNQSKRWNFPNYYYSFRKVAPDGATVDFVMIDTVQFAGNSGVDHHGLSGSELPGAADAEVAGAQLDFIKKQLQGNTADYIIVAGHYPVYSIAEHGPTSQLQEELRPLLRQYGVSAYLCGHEHNEQHIDVGDGVQYHVIGSAHGKDSSTAHAGTIKKDQLKFHSVPDGGFATVQVTKKGMVITHLDGSGKVLYTAPAIAPRSSPSPSPPSPSPPSPPAPSPKTWECHEKHSVSVGTDKDLKGTGSDITSCEQRCEQTTGCGAVLWHRTDSHCHILTGSFSYDDFVSKLKSDSDHDACFWKDAPDGTVVV
jgi:tartrate-resistant acid phosphatase type 5